MAMILNPWRALRLERERYAELSRHDVAMTGEVANLRETVYARDASIRDFRTRLAAGDAENRRLEAALKDAAELEAGLKAQVAKFDGDGDGAPGGGPKGGFRKKKPA